MNTDNTLLSFRVRSTDTSIPLGLRVQVDNATIYETNHVIDPIIIKHEMPDDNGKHLLTLELFGKLPEHTKIDDAGNILSDSILEFDSFVVADIDVDQIMFTKSVYHHDTNGTQPTQDAQFYGAMGCNGIVSLKFTTPVYLWLLENM
jgi:hypothetical protein